jgi:hypothetical protein
MNTLKAFLFLLLTSLPCAAATTYRQVPVAIHVHSNWSRNGDMSLARIAETAAAAGIRAVILSDHDIMKCEYGLPPFRDTLKRTVEFPSVLKNGPEKYLAEIRGVNESHPNVLLIPGVESTPYYFWTGQPWKKDLTLNDWHKHLLVAGLYHPDDYRRLPVLGNEAAAGRINSLRLWPLLLVPAGLLLMKIRRIAGRALFYAGALATFINFPFNSLPFSQYDGRRNEAPYQGMIDYVARTAPDTGMVFWAHPEAPNFDTPKKLHGISLLTAKYPDALLSTRGYTGFGYFQEGAAAVGSAGGIWDGLLTGYVTGQRRSPVWAVGELDYRADGKHGTYIDSFKNIVLLPENEPLTPATLIHAIRSGRFYVAAKQHKGGELLLKEFCIRNASGSAMMGETLKTKGSARLSVQLSTTGTADVKVKLVLLDKGRILRSIDTTTPVDMTFPLPSARESTYYRLEAATVDKARIVSNPIFIE